MVVVSGKIIGLVIYCHHRPETMIHIMVKPEDRGKYAYLFAKKELKDRSGILYTEILDLYPNVLKFAKRLKSAEAWRQRIEVRLMDSLNSVALRPAPPKHTQARQSGNLTTRPTKNKDEINSIIRDPDIYECIRDDSTDSIENISAPLDAGWEYIGGYVDNKIIALMIFHNEDRLYCHVHVLHEYREKYAALFGRMAMAEKKTERRSVYAKIPSIFPNVIRFAETQSFKIIDKLEKEFRKDGIDYDVYLMRFE